MAVKASVLIVEDNLDWQTVLIELLKEEEFSIKTALSYCEARSKLGTDTFDLIIIDLRLGPEEDNRDGMALVKDACGKGIPAIVVTGYGTRDMVEKANRYDALAVIHKSAFEEEVFKQAVNKALTIAKKTPQKKCPSSREIEELLRNLLRIGQLK